MSEFLHKSISHDGQAVTVALDRPPLNVMNIEMMERVNDVLLSLRQHDGLKVLVLRGKGRAFCGGVDVTEHTKDKVQRLLQVFHRIFETIRLLDVVSIAAVDGLAAGGGFELALGCNMVVASEASRFVLPEVRQGVFPPVAAIVLPRAAPRRKAMEWILLAEEITAAELANHGLVNRVWADKAFDKELDALIARLVSHSGPVMQLARRAQTENYYATYEEALYRVENLYLRELMALDDPHEGMKAFLEKRAPTWQNG